MPVLPLPIPVHTGRCFLGCIFRNVTSHCISPQGLSWTRPIPSCPAVGLHLYHGLSFLPHQGAARFCSELVRELAIMATAWDKHGAQLRVLTWSLAAAGAAPCWR